MKPPAQKHAQAYPSARKIRRSCSNELYRTVKRMKVYVAKEKIEAAEKLYYQKVVLNLPWIVEQHNNRKAQADWWVDNLSSEIAELWEVDRVKLVDAFRDAYGG